MTFFRIAATDVLKCHNNDHPLNAIIDHMLELNTFRTVLRMISNKFNTSYHYPPQIQRRLPQQKNLCTDSSIKDQQSLL